MDQDLKAKIEKEHTERHETAVKLCMESPAPLHTAFEEVLKRWDALGAHKDDDFGEVHEAVEVAREVFKRTSA